MKSPKVTYYEFEYCVCKLSGLVTEKPIMSFPEAGFATIEAAVYYAVKIHDNYNNTFVFKNDKPVAFIIPSGKITYCI